MVEVGDISVAVYQYSSYLYLGLIILMFILLLVGGIFFVLYFKIYNIEVEVFDIRANTKNNLYRTKARRITDAGTVAYKLWGKKIFLRPPNDMNILYTIKRRDHIKIVRFSETEYAYVQFKIDDKILIPIHADIKMWWFINQERVKEKYGEKSFWSQYGTYVVFGISIMLIFLAFWFLIQETGHAIDVANELGNKCINAQTQNIAQATPPG